MDAITGYAHAIVSLALFAVLALALNPWAGIARGRAGLVPGQMPEPDYASRAFRITRSYQNTVEMTGVFAAVVAAAVLAGANPFWVNLLASLALVSRIAMIFVHVQGIGKANNGLRTIFFVAGWAMMLLLALIAAVAAV
ncbi:MAPEG family protein [Rhodobacteraceae bacterium 2CG4]|uniref:MAPEG family protein n=1 Tax=Halovulum marinum TaxID=2662447 RepID=A0A6L5YYH1_9RHOB|nr:MAPEG family protein [Halovulum marinum]MSU88922.1 MAPEG family protein [Halovulum marinum]